MRQGFTLVELLVVMAIVAVLGVMAAATINPIAQVGKANDAKRKKDLNRIKVAFEEYFNDKGCYPTQATINALGCNSIGFNPWGLNSWPCDPETRIPYYIFVDPGAGCPLWFKILTNLDNKKDAQIPAGWYVPPNTGRTFGDGTLGTNKVNFGISSTNVLWNE